MSPEWIWLVFVSAFGCCVGSFLNVVVYRLPRDKSLVSPPSACPHCNKHIRFYDNIPLISWLLLCGKCRYCGGRISPRYFVVELLSGLGFVLVFVLYFIVGVRRFEIGGSFGLSAFVQGGWVFYLVHITMLAAFLAASAIDLELWIIPLSICWFVTAVGLAGSAVGQLVIGPRIVQHYQLFPVASPTTGALAVGALVGLVISLVLLAAEKIPRSYESDDDSGNGQIADEQQFGHRAEILKEVVFLLPIAICAFGAFWLNKNWAAGAKWWFNISQIPVISGLLGSLWGYFVGCAVVWCTRIGGTLAFGKEAMGLGDVHLMGAAGAVIGPVFVVIAFFIAPFFGLAWAGSQMFFKKTRQIPYGPFLSLAVLVVMILHDRIVFYMSGLYLYR